MKRVGSVTNRRQAAPSARAGSFRRTMGIVPAAFIALAAAALLGLAASPSFAMPPHPSIMDQYQQMIAVNPAMSPAALYARGIDAPAAYPDGSPIWTPGKGPSGSFNVLAILVDFSDNTAATATPAFDSLLYGGAVGSLNHYYSEVSYTTLSLVTVNMPSSMGWMRAPQSYAYYVAGNNGFGSYPNNAQRLTEDAVALADASVDFSQYDNDGDGFVDALFVIHAGRGAELTGSLNDIWSHAWVTNSPVPVDGVTVWGYSMEPEYWSTPGDMTVGVYAHELGHTFGLPDWYDYGYDSSGVGDWCLMAGGSWNGSFGNSPSHISAEGKWRLDFVSPTVISANTTSLAVPQVETNQTDSVFYLWDNGGSNSEYFLIENRQRTGYDAALPHHGLLIWHVDTMMNGNDNQCRSHDVCSCGLHYELALLQADGLLDLEYNRDGGDTGDPYPGFSNNTTFDLNSTPNSGSYSDCSSNVAVTNISASSPTMTVDVQVCGPATYNLATGSLDIPSVIILGKTGTYQAHLEKRAGPGYVLDMIWAMRIADGCQAASFDPSTGILDIPDLNIAGTTRTVAAELTKLPGGYTFELTNLVK